MQVSQIISEIDKEIARLQEARRLLGGEGGAASKAKGKRGRRKAVASAPKKRRGRRNLTPEGRKAISDALKARWAERKKAAAKKSK